MRPLSPYEMHQRQRFLRPDAYRWMRPDAARFFKTQPLPRAVAAPGEHKFRVGQLRIPRGQEGGGRFTDEGGASGGEGLDDLQLVAGDGSRGRGGLALIFIELASKLVEAFRSENGLFDLFGSRTGTVAHTSLDGNDIFGSNSTSPTYTGADRRAAEQMRDLLIQKYPEVMNIDNIGYKPNDALFHAETNILLRAAQQNGGTLSGRSLDIYVDRPMCSSCSTVLPKVGLELGNPTVRFFDPDGRMSTISDGLFSDGDVN